MRINLGKVAGEVIQLSVNKYMGRSFSPTENDRTSTFILFGPLRDPFSKSGAQILNSDVSLMLLVAHLACNFPTQFAISTSR